MASVGSATSLIREIFGSRREFLRYYEAQERCLQFGSILLPIAHCAESSRSIRRFFLSSGTSRAFLFGIDCDLTSLLGSLHHYLQNREAPSRVPPAGQAAKLWQMLELYFRLERDVLARFSEGPATPASAFTPTLQDLNYSRLVQRMAGDSLEKSSAAHLEFYTLLFFDLHSAFKHFRRHGTNDPVITNIAAFVLRVLPLLIGEYRFGALGSDLKDLAFFYADSRLFHATEHALALVAPNVDFRRLLRSDLELTASRLRLEVKIVERRKGVFSAYLKSLNYGVPIEDLWDLYGFRVVIFSSIPEDCYRFLSEIQARWQRWQGVKGYFDYIKRPKKNGYKSLHVTLSHQGELIELQIRTVGMNAVAEFGTASHSVYKQRHSGFETGQVMSEKARRGASLLRDALQGNGLTLNDFIAHLGPSLDYVPVEHYYERIADGTYDFQVVLRSILGERGMK